MQLRAKRGAQRGMSMIEVTIGMAVGAMLLASAMMISDRSTQQNTGRATADALSGFQQLAGQYIIANRTAIEAAMGGDASKQAIHCLVNVAADGTGGTVTSNNTKRTCAFDATLLRKNSLWPTGVSVEASPAGRYVAIARQQMTTGGSPVPTGADEVLFVLAPTSSGSVLTTGTVAFSGDAKRALEEINASVNALGGTGGYVPPGVDTGGCAYNGTTKQVCGPGWTATLSDFIN
jgi:prepilin-type N-terminal cleavage/methylation domain-containing protein